MELACGQCWSCRLRRSRDWAIRAKHESQGYSKNCFVTLTYRDQDVPINGVSRKAISKFMKDLRNHYGAGIRFMACGEYGEKLHRPHYHLCLFNHQFEDAYQWQPSQKGSELYRSDTLERIWPHGFSSIGALTAESAGYTARYVLKKVTGERSQAHYQSVCPVTGEIFDLNPEFIQVSNRPGLGTAWIEKNYWHVYARDSVIHKGKEYSVPLYYDKWLKANHPDLMEEVSHKRLLRRLTTDQSEWTDERLLQADEAKEAKVRQQLPRDYEK